MLGKIKDWFFKNRTPNQTILKNTFWLFFGQIFSRLLRAAIVIYAARLLGAASWGAFSYVLSLATFLTIFSDFGINALVTRETSKNPELRNKYLSTALFIKIGLVILLGIILFAVGGRITKIEEAKILIPLLIFMFGFDTIRDLATTINRAMERMEIEAGLVLVTNFLIVALGFIFLSFRPTAYSLATSYAVGSGLGLIISLIALRKYFTSLFSHFDRKLVREIISLAWPFGLLALLGTVMLNTDIIMLGWMSTATEVGWYATAQKPLQLLYVLPALLATAFFPSLSKLAMQDDKKEQFERLIEKALMVVLTVALPITLGGLVVGDQLIPALFGSAYQASVTSFLILLLTIPIVFPSTILGNALFAYNRQRQFIGYVALGAGSNFIANLILIPRYGIAGAAVATVLSNILSNALLWIKMKKIAPIKLGTPIVKPLFISLVMAGVVLALKEIGVPLYLNIAVGAAVYGLLIRKVFHQTITASP